MTPLPLSVCIQSCKFERRFAEEFFRTFVLQRQKLPLNRADTGGGDVAVLRAVFRSVVGNVFQHTAQVFQIQNVPAFVVGDFEHEVQQPSCVSFKFIKRASSMRAHFRNGYAHRNAGFAVNIPKAHGETLQPLLAQTKLGNAFAHLAAGSTRLRDARQSP